MLITKDRYFYKTFFSLLMFLALQNMIVLLVNLIDNIMIGNFDGDFALSGVTTVNQIQFVYQQLLLGTSDALVVMGSQYWAQKRREPLKYLTNGAMLIGLSIGLVLFLLSVIMPESLIRIFTDDAQFISYGVEYLAIIKYTFPIFAISTILLASLKTVETVKLSLFTSVISLILNAGINYLLIFGNFVFPRLGVTGAAIGTLTARIVELAIILFYILQKDKKLEFRAKDFFRIDGQLFRDFLKKSVPFITVAGLFGISTALQTVILGHLKESLAETGASAIAANSISSTMYMLLKVASIGAASSAAIIIGQSVGRNEVNKAKEYAKTLQLIFLTMGILTSIILFNIKGPILSLYTISDETRALAEQFILVLCVTCIGTSYQMPTVCGIIRGGGDSKFVLINDIISIWGIVLPVSFLAAFVWKLPPVAIVFCLNSDQLFKCGAACIKVNRFRWMKKLTLSKTNVEEQIAHEKE